MSGGEKLACVAITMILANAYILILCTLQMRHNIKYAKRLKRIQHRLACKEEVLRMMERGIMNIMKNTP